MTKILKARTGFAFVTAKGLEAFVMSILRAAPKDVEWASRPDVMSFVVQCIYVHHEHMELIILPKSGYFVLHQDSSRFLKGAKEDLKISKSGKSTAKIVVFCKKTTSLIHMDDARCFIFGLA